MDISGIGSILNNLASYLGARGLVVLDRHGFIITQYIKRNSKQIKTLLNLFGNYFLAIDSLMKDFKLSSVKYAVVETGDSIILTFKVDNGDEPLYVAVFYESGIVPLGAVLLKISEIGDMIRDIGRLNRVKVESTSVSEGDMDRILDEIKDHPLYKSLINKDIGD